MAGCTPAAGTEPGVASGAGAAACFAAASAAAFSAAAFSVATCAARCRDGRYYQTLNGSFSVRCGADTG